VETFGEFRTCFQMPMGFSVKTVRNPQSLLLNRPWLAEVDSRLENGFKSVLNTAGDCNVLVESRSPQNLLI
jgi:hypothetical protein